MKLIFTFLFCLFFTPFMTAQLVINELDADTQSVDDKEFIELLSQTPNFNLDGYVLVLFNGSNSGGDSSYFTLDLSGYTTDVNGILLIGSNTVSPIPQYIVSANLIQNGADAVAIYQAEPEDFPEGTLATTENLIDALVYDTSDSDDDELMALLGVSEQINENENSNKDFESIQRNNDGSYTVKEPTPRALNDGSGVALNGISFTASQELFTEGDNFVLSFEEETAVEEDLTVTFSLTNAGFTEADYTGNTFVTFEAGTASTTTTITLVDDDLDEGDEELIINLDPLPDGFIPLTDEVTLRVVDNDFAISSWGTPLDPTYDNVNSTAPTDYYATLEGLADEELRQAMQNIIANEEIVRTQTYADIIDILKEADQNPENNNQVWLVYTEQGRAKLDFQTTSDSDGKWNREHTYPRSRGGFYSIEEDDFADGREIFIKTNADSLRHGNSDAHALRAVDGGENSSRGNQYYGEYTGPAGTAGSFYGDVARSVLYMAIRYNGLAVVNGFPDQSTEGQLGDLETLLNWHRNDPPDDFEMNRNNVIYTWQYNRNPFIDYPEFVEHIWGNKQGEPWSANLSLSTNRLPKITLYPNPTTNYFKITGLPAPGTVTIYSLDGRLLYQEKIVNEEPINTSLTSGTYLIEIQTKNNRLLKKLIIK